jgi:hypothetical protein
MTWTVDSVRRVSLVVVLSWFVAACGPGPAKGTRRRAPRRRGLGPVALGWTTGTPEQATALLVPYPSNLQQPG